MNNEELSDSVKAYLKNKDSLVQLKEQESNLPKGYGDSIGWIFYCLYALPIAAIIIAGGAFLGPVLAIFAILFILNKWLNEGEKLVEDEKKLAKEFRAKKRNSRKKKFFKRNENGEMVEEDSP